MHFEAATWDIEWDLSSTQAVEFRGTKGFEGEKVPQMKGYGKTV